MAITVADLLIKLGVEGAEQAKQGILGVESGLTKFGTKALGIGGMLTAGVTAPLLLVGKSMFSAASNLSEAQNQVETVFGSSGVAIQDWAKGAATNLGLSERAANEWASNFGFIFTEGAGQAVGAAAGLSEGIVGLGSDLASFNNTSPDEALTALRAGLTGEYEPLKRYGIFMSEAAVQAKAMEMGLVDANGEVTEQGKILARQELIMEKAGVQQGDFARTAGGAANMQRILRAQLENTAATMGNALLPAGTMLLGMVGKLFSAFANLPQGLITAIVAFGAFVAAVGPAISVIGAVAVALGVLLSPIGLIIGALALLAVAYKTNFMGFGDLVDRVASAVGDKLRALGAGLQTFAKLVKFSFDMFRAGGQNPVTAAFNAMSRGLDFAARKVPALAGAFSALSNGSKAVAKFAESVGKEFAKGTKIFDTLRNSGLNPVAAGFKTMGALLQDVAHNFGPLSGAALAVGNALGTVGEFAQRVWYNFQNLRGSSGLVGGALQAVGATLGQMSGHFGIFEGAIQSVSKAFMGMGAAFNQGIKGIKDLLSGDVSGALDHFKNALSALQGVFTNLGSAGKQALSAIWDQLSGVDWGGVASGIGDAIGGIRDQLLGVDWGGIAISVWNAVMGAFGAINWGEVWSTVTSAVTTAASAGITISEVLIDGAAKLGRMLQGIADDLSGWLTKQLNAGLDYLVTLSGVKVDASDPDTGPAERSIGDKLAQIDWYKVSGNQLSFNIGDAIGKRIADGLNKISLDNLLEFSRIGSSIQAKLLTAVAGIFAGGGLLAGNMSSLMSGLFTGVVSNIDWGQVGSTLKGRWQDVLQLLATSIGGVPLQIGKAIGDLLRSQIGTIDWGGIGDSIKQKLSGALNGMTLGPDALSTMAQSAIGAISLALYNKITAGADFGTVILQGIREKINGLALSAAAFPGFAKSIGDSIANAIKNAVDGWSGATVKSAITSKINSLTAAAGEFVSLAASIGAALLADLKAWVQQNITWGTITSWISDQVPSLPKKSRDFSSDADAAKQATSGKNDMGDLGGSSSGALAAAGTAAAGAAAAIGAAAAAIAGHMARIAQATAQGWSQAAATTTSASAQMASATQSSFSRIASVVQSSTSQASAAAQNGFRQMQSAIQSAMTSAAASVTASMGQIRSVAQSTASAVGSAGQQAGSSFRSGVQSGMQGAVSAAHSARGAIIGAVSGISLFGQGASIGQSLGSGISAGIQGMIGAVASAAAALVSAAVAAARNAGAIRSPSRKTMEIGNYLVDGLLIPLQNRQGEAQAAMRGLFDFSSSGPRPGPGAGGGGIHINQLNVTLAGLSELFELQDMLGARGRAIELGL